MKMMFIAVAVFMAFQSQAHAENWSALGILTTHNPKMNHFKTEFVEIKGFKSREACEQVLTPQMETDEYIGKGGTNGKVPGLQWNYDATCVHINDE